MDFFNYRNVEFTIIHITFYDCIITRSVSDLIEGEYVGKIQIDITNGEMVTRKTIKTDSYTKVYKINSNGTLSLIKVY